MKSKTRYTPVRLVEAGYEPWGSSIPRRCGRVTYNFVKRNTNQLGLRPVACRECFVLPEAKP
ncbi:MAG: hypothetical protein ACLPJH_00290 [Myxococcaceae bacterium]